MIIQGDKPKRDFPKDPKYFKEGIINEILNLEDTMLPIHKVIEVDVSPSIMGIKLVETTKGTGHDGTIDTGYKVLVQIKLRGKMLYITNYSNQSVQGANFEMIKHFSVGVPEKMGKQSIGYVYSKGLLDVQPYIEKVYARALDNKTIQCCIALFLNINTYQ